MEIRRPSLDSAKKADERVLLLEKRALTGGNPVATVTVKERPFDARRPASTEQHHSSNLTILCPCKPTPAMSPCWPKRNA